MKKKNTLKFKLTIAYVLIFIIGFLVQYVAENVVFKTTKESACSVVRVVDGDTFTCMLDDKEVKVRLIGVNTPEINTPNGVIASNYTKGLLAGKTVTLEFDKDRYDKYDRTLAYVYLEDGTMLNELLLENGYAEVMTVEPNTRYKYRFQKIENKAKGKKIGIWK